MGLNDETQGRPTAQEQPSEQPSRPGKADHLREYRFAPGQSGNPGGRPRGRGVFARVNELLYRTEFAGSQVPGGRQVIDLVAEIYVKNMLLGSLAHVNAGLPYIDGPPVDETAEAEQAGSIDPAMALRMLKAANEPDAPTSL